MVFGVSVVVFALILASVTAGATVQGMVGLGLALVAAPIITIVAPELMPGLMIWLGCFLPAIHLITQRGHVDWGALAYVLPARLPGTAFGALLVVWMTSTQLGVLVGTMVLLAVLLTWRAVVIPVNRATLILGGAISGVTGTATSIGGPPVALLLQRRAPQQIRDTMAGFFLVGSAMSLIGLAISDQLVAEQLWIALVLLPCLALGLNVGRVISRRVDAAAIRPAILIVCACSAAALLVRSLVG